MKPSLKKWGFFIMSNGQYSSFTPVGEVRVNPHTPHIRSLTDYPLPVYSLVYTINLSYRNDHYGNPHY